MSLHAGEVSAAIVTAGLRRRYGTRDVLKGVDLVVHKGEIFGLIGPNGAGKTTFIEITQGLRQATDGLVKVLGRDPGREGRQLRRHIGTCLQETRFPERLTVSEVADLFGRIYEDIEDSHRLIRQFELCDLKHRYCHALSHGQQQRLAVALAFVGQPELVFLDEPSAGLDANTREILYNEISQGKSLGRTYLLTTHYYEEAARLCDRIAVLNDGTLVATGTLAELRAQFSPEAEVRVRWSPPRVQLKQYWALSAVDSCTLDADGCGMVLSTLDPPQAISEIVRRCDALCTTLTDIEVRRPSLHEVFVKAISTDTISKP